MSLPPFIQQNLQWFVCGLIAVGGIAIYGIRDLAKFSVKRVWAISSVCFSESVRRKVWLITPLAILGVIIVSQLQKPADERDAIRQTIKFCLFATGLLVTITAIILACTNLPREIENRVIYTVVTKPTTRLEIVLGKIVGFARVSALILLIMGLFTYGYLHWRAWVFDAGIRERLASGADVDEVSKPTLEYYRDAGLLTAREMAMSDDVQVYASLPDARSGRRFVAGAGEGDMIVPFEVRPVDLVPAGVQSGPDFPPGVGGLLFMIRVGAERIPGYVEPASTSSLPVGVAAPATSQPIRPPLIMLQLLDPSQSPIVRATDISGGQPVPLTDPTGKEPTQIMIPPAAAQTLYKPGSDVSKPMKFYAQVTPAGPGYNYFVDPNPVDAIVPAKPGHEPRLIKPALDSHGSGQPSQPILRGREGIAGQQIRGGAGDVPVAVYAFRNAAPTETTGDVSFEFRSGIERGGSDSESDEGATQISIVAYDRDSKQESPPATIALESNHQSYFRLPAKFLASGNFDIQIRCKSTGHFVGLQQSSLAMVRSLQPFGSNLVKSLLIMWFMAILVITIAIFTSVFVSWPTAIVLTLVILLGRWGVEQLGDATQPGIGAMIVTDMQLRDPNKAKVVSSMAETLAGGLNALAKILPDITQFAATEDIERGMVVPPAKLGTALQMTLMYGLAVLSLAYVRLTWVEVAP